MIRPTRTLTGVNAFTLVEMLLVLVLMAALTSGLAVSFGGRQDLHALKIAAKDLAAAINYVQRQTELTHRPHRISFDDEAASFRIESAPSTSSEDFTSVVGFAGRKHVLPKGVRITEYTVEGTRQASLESCWRLLPGKDIPAGEIVLVNRQDEELRVKVMPITGQVQITEVPAGQ